MGRNQAQSPIATTEEKANKKYSILADHLGIPTQMYNEEGESIWERSLDMNGKVQEGSHRGCPFLCQGQYYDEEIELAYNRFRWYSDEDGRYISKDPIGLNSGKPNFNVYVEDSNGWIDPLGLSSYSKKKKRTHWEMKKAGSGRKKKTGRKAKRGRKPKKSSTHGNSKDYDGVTFLYKRYNEDGVFQKHGKNNNPDTRYSKKELGTDSLEIEDSGSRRDMLKKERHRVENNPGPLNKEPWANK